MRSRFECPRCGAGIKPDDVQCGRCGARLKEDAPVERVPAPHVSLDSPSIEGVISNFEAKIEMGRTESPKVERVMKRLEKKRRSLDIREKELKEREQRLQTALEEMERDSRALEESIQDLEEQQEDLQEREKVLLENEEKMSTLAQRLEEWEQLVDKNLGSLDDRTLSHRLQKLHQLQSELQESLSENRRIIEEGGEGPSEPAVSGGREREEQIMEGSESLEGKVKEIFDELDSQIGLGFQGEVTKNKVSTYIEKLDQILEGGYQWDMLHSSMGPPVP